VIVGQVTRKYSIRHLNKGQEEGCVQLHPIPRRNAEASLDNKAPMIKITDIYGFKGRELDKANNIFNFDFTTLEHTSKINRCLMTVANCARKSRAPNAKAKPLSV